MRGRCSDEPHFLEEETGEEKARDLPKNVQRISGQAWSLGSPSLEQRRTWGEAKDEPCTQGFGTGLSEHGQSPRSCLEGSWPGVSERPVEKPEQTGAVHASRQCEVVGRGPGSCLWHISLTLDRLQWDGWSHRGGRAVKPLHAAGAEPSHPLLSLNSRSSFLRLPETDALVGIVRCHLHQQPQG